MKRLGLYARVSTDTQTLEPQLHALREYAGRLGVEAVEYQDHAVSGRRERRPGLDGLLAAARKREIDAVAVVKLDRLGRSLTHLLHVLGELEDLGVRFIALDDAIDSSTASGRLFLQIRGALAEYEASLTRERVAAGIAAAKRRGTRCGRPPALDAERAARARRLHQHGTSLRKIAAMLECSRAAIATAINGKG